MDLLHRFTLPVEPERVWNALNDIAGLAPCFPGATVTAVEGDEFTGSVRIKFGPAGLVYTGTGRYVERDPEQHRLVLEARGDERRGSSSGVATATVRLHGEGAETEVQVLTDLAISGRPAQFGQGVITDVSNKLLDQFVSRLGPSIAAGLGGPPAEAPSTADAEPDTESAAERTIELGAVPEDLGETFDVAAPGDPEPPAVPTPAPAPSTPPPSTPPPAAPRRAASYTPPRNTAQSSLDVVSTVGPVLLKRYWPVLAGGTLAVFVVSRIVRRKR